jgi:predicted phage terminase large subunit-like protein
LTVDTREQYKAAMARARALSDSLTGPGWIERWARLPREKRDAVLAELSRGELARLAYDWKAWARPKQDPDLVEHAHRVLLFLGGRGSGKSAMAIQRIKQRVYAGARRMALVGPTIGEIERYMIGVDDDENGLLSAFPPRHRPEYVGRPTPRVTFHTGAFAYVESAENPEFRGANLDTAWCFPAETPITMHDGTSRAIADVAVGDLVLTRSGPRRVLRQFLTRRQAPLMRLVASDGRYLEGTAEHPIHADGRFTPLSELPAGATLTVWPNESSSITSPSSSGHAATTKTAQGSRSTGSSGSPSTGRSRRVARSTTATATSSTTDLRTSSSSTPLRIAERILLEASRLGPPSTDRSCERPHGESKSPLCANASDAARSTRREAPTATGAAQSARRPRDITVSSVVSASRSADVFDLEVEGAHEFFANGILVHNCDEPIKWRKLKTLFENIENATRSAMFPNEIIVTTTAKKTAAGRFLRELIADQDTVTILGSSEENKYNDQGWLANRKRKIGGTRAGREELDPDETVLDDDEHSLFHESWIDDNRVEAPPRSLRIAIGVDPAITQSERSDLTGIVVVSEGPDGDLYVLEDRTGRHSPAAWGRIVIDLYDKHQADAIVAEKNRGGNLVDEVLRGAMTKKRGERAADALIVKLVTASKGKVIRADPVSALYEKGRVHHVPREELAELEREMTEWEPASGMPSPNRLDALVWAIHFLARLDDEEVDNRETTRGLGALTQAARKAVARIPSRPLTPPAMGAAGRFAMKPIPKRTI